MNPVKFWKRFVLWAVLILAVIAPSAVLAAEEEQPRKIEPAPSIWDSLVPEGEEKVGKVTVEYEKYPLSHYQLDIWLKERSFWDFVKSPIEETKGKITDSGIAMLHIFINMGWQLIVEMSRLVIWILEESLKLDIVNELIEYVGEGVRNIAGFEGNLQDRGFYGLMLPLVTILFAAYTGYRAMEENDEMTLINGILTFFLITLGSFAFFFYIEDIAKELNKFGTEMGKGLMALTTNTFQPTKNLNAKEATAQAGNNIWNMTVMTPFKLLEFGTMDVDQKRVDAILSTHPEQRGELLNKEKKVYGNQMILPSSIGGRGVFVFLLFFMNLFVWAIPVFIAFYKLVFQGWFLVVLLLSPIALAWAVVPPWRDILYKWAAELLGAVLMQVALGLMLAIYLAVGGALYEFGEEKGYLLMVLLQIVLVITIFKQRKMIFSFVIWPSTFLRWNAGFHQKYPTWSSISPHRLENLFEGAFSDAFIRDMARDLKKLRGKVSFGSMNFRKEQTNQEDIPELQEIEKNKEEVIFQPYDDPQLTGKDQDQLGAGKNGDAMLLEQEQDEKPLLLNGADQETEVVDADVKYLEEHSASNSRPIEGEKDAPMLLFEPKEAKPSEKAEDEGPILLIEPKKKEGQDRNDR